MCAAAAMRLGLLLMLTLAAAGCSGLYSKIDGGGGGTGGGGASGCTAAEQCPQPANSTAACTGGVCQFVCAPPLLHCPSACCTATAVAAGATHTCVITNLGGVKCWGASPAAGDGTFEQRDSPTDVEGLTGRAVEITAGIGFTCARLEDGAVECWGLGTLGDGTKLLSTRAKATTLPGPATQLAAGGAHACASSDGGAFCWGTDAFGEQGTNGGGTRLTPGNVPGLVYNAKQIASGYHHNCALLNDGGAVCWGQNIAGECGDGTYQMQRNVPVKVTAIDAGISQLYGGYSVSCARTVTGRIKCWGTNSSGQCGSGVASTRSLVAVDVKGVTAGLTQLALGSMAQHACIVQDGGVFCWGLDDHGQLGDGNLGTQNAPVPVLGITVPVTAVAPGAAHTCAVTAEGGVLCWGKNTDGQLGIGTHGADDHLSPVLVR